MQSFPFSFHGGHPFIALNGGDWLLDTGAPGSFGAVRSLAVAGETFRLPESTLGLTTDNLSAYVGHPTAGLIGVDILNRFDVIMDVPNGNATLSGKTLELKGVAIETGEFMGILTVQTEIKGRSRRMFFDTGAQWSYLQDDTLQGFPAAGEVDDFYPGFGRFRTATHWVDLTLGGAPYVLRFGSLPGLLGLTLAAAGATGIIGNEIIRNRVVGYFPRRQSLVIG